MRGTRDAKRRGLRSLLVLLCSPLVVTVLAWIFILLSGLGVVMLTFEFFLFGAVMTHVMEAARNRGDPVPAGFMFDHLQLVFEIVTSATRRHP